MKRLAERGVEVFFTQVFRDSFFHADMHPGNIFVSTVNPNDPQYITIDFGIVGTLNSEDKRYLAENFIAFFNRNYRKVAELHVDSGWVPSDTDIDDFEASIRQVCEPIFQKPLAEIEFSNVLLQLFNTARRFNMVIQPQLVLLQKTLLYIEGLGRQLYPQLDLWKTAKPFLENWMKEQIGLKAMYQKISTNLPYWSEKFPEIPDLVYDTLKQVKKLPEQQKLQFELQQQQMRQQHRSSQLLIIGATFFITAALLPIYQTYWWPSVGCITVGVISWIGAWRIK
jgi:ubiquinone biosynthesis protein